MVVAAGGCECDRCLVGIGGGVGERGGGGEGVAIF